MKKNPIAAGSSSFGLIAPARLFAQLQLKRDAVLVDLASGNGSYSVAASEYIGPEGKIHAFDLWEEGIEALLKEIAVKHIRNIRAAVVDITKDIPIEDHAADVCLMATVLHDLIQEGTEKGALREVGRILKPDGIFAVIEFKKIEGPPGPPLRIRLSPEELENILSSYGFRLAKTTDIGPYNYLSVFGKSGDR